MNELLTLQDAATRLGLSSSALRVAKSRRADFPSADGTIGGHEGWWLATIAAWRDKLDVQDWRLLMEWNSFTLLYHAPSSPGCVVWECALCGDGADSQMGTRTLRDLVRSHLRTCPLEPADEYHARRVDFMREYGRPIPEP